MSTRYNTGNPIESTDVRDMSDNAKNFDEFSNSMSDSFTDRLGRNRQTIEGSIRKSGFQPAAFDFVTGGTLAPGDRNKAVFNPEPSGDNNWYAWQGEFPKIISPNSTPATSGGIGESAWKPVTNNILAPTVRESIRRSYAEAGYNLVDGSFEAGGTLVNANDVLLYEAEGKAYSWGGAFDKAVPSRSTPSSAGGIGPTEWTDRSESYLTTSVRRFGAVGDGFTDDTAAFLAAIASGAAVIEATPAPATVYTQYIISSTLVVPDGVTLKGFGVGVDKKHPVTLLFKGTGTKSYTLPGFTSVSVANPSVGLPYLADSGTRGDTYKTTDFTVPFSAAVILGRHSSLLNLAVIPYFNGIAGYQSVNFSMSDNWDVGIWGRNADGCTISGVLGQGHWRKSGLLLSSSDIGDGRVPACERCHIEFCGFEGMYGVSIRAPAAPAGTNYGFAGTDFINCNIRGLWHQSGHLATSSLLAEPQPQPSGCLEVDGNVGINLRGVQFLNTTFMTRDDILFFTDHANELAFTGCYFESQPVKVNNASLANGLGARLISTSNTNAMKMVSHTEYGIDVTPYFSVPDVSMQAGGSSRYLNAGVFVPGVWNPAIAAMDDWQQLLFAGNVSIRLRNSTQTWGVRDANANLNWYVDATGANSFTTNIRSLTSSITFNRFNGSAFEAAWRVFSSGNGEWGNGVNQPSITYKFNGAVLPLAAAANNLGSNALPWNNIYTQNAVTVISDENFKSQISEIPDALIEAVGAVPFKMWKLNAAIAEKGDAARWHAGVIAQQVKQAITDAGLDWHDYGLITYEETRCEVESVDGKYQPVDSDNCNLPLNSDGFIDWIDGADSVTGTIYIRGTYMMRMEEFHSIKLAWMERLLSL